MTFSSTIIKKLRATTIAITGVMLCTFNYATYAGEISFHNTVINATPPGIKVTAAYMEIHNDSDNSITLVSAKGNISDHIELHQHTMKEGLMSMHQVKGITAPAMTDTILSPGGYHIMIMNLEHAVNENSQHNITLTFSNGLQKTILFTAHKPGTQKHSQHSTHHGKKHTTKANTHHNDSEHEATREHNEHHKHSVRH